LEVDSASADKLALAHMLKRDVMPNSLRKGILGFLISVFAASLLVVRSGVAPAAAGIQRAKPASIGMSPMGAKARAARRALRQAAAAPLGAAAAGPRDFEDEEGGGPGALDDGGELPGGNQGELAIAIDDTGRHVVIGFNDFRGFSGNPLSVSGFMYSDDGGKTFVDGGQLPITTGTVDFGGTLLPQVFGDPDVKYLGACNFIYTSILVAPFAGNTTAVQTMGFHRSTDCGHTWEGPFEIASASNPSGLFFPSGDPFDAADKEQIDVDRSTGRVIMSWTNFSFGAEISTTYSDNVLAPSPVWSPRVIVGARPDDGQAATPRFGPEGSHAVYVAWETFTPSGLAGISEARSSDDGGAPLLLRPGRGGQRGSDAGELHVLRRRRAIVGGAAASVASDVPCGVGERYRPAESRRLQPGGRQSQRRSAGRVCGDAPGGLPGWTARAVDDRSGADRHQGAG
jgi:hypothetical protein